MFKPTKARQMTTPAQIMTPTETIKHGVPVKTLVPGERFNCNFATYGGTETNVNGIIAVEDTANVVTWFNPNITAGCVIRRLTDNADFEVIGEPENLEERQMLMLFKVKRFKGGA